VVINAAQVLMRWPKLSLDPTSRSVTLTFEINLFTMPTSYLNLVLKMCAAQGLSMQITLHSGATLGGITVTTPPQTMIVIF
jgi:hypothetical protein